VPESDEATFEAHAGDEQEEQKGPARQQKIVTLRLVAKAHSAFPGDELILGLRGVGLRHGKFGIFHRYDGNDEKRVVFSAASLVEPGSFDLADIKNQAIPGISLFMVLPGPLDGAQAFDQMMSAGRDLARTLNAELLDESGSTMSVQRERYLREEIIQYQHGIKVA
jgi:cell division protein ZipA